MAVVWGVWWYSWLELHFLDFSCCCSSLEFLCNANRHLLEVKEALWDRNSTDILFILKYSIPCILILSNTFLITPTKCTILLHCIYSLCVLYMSWFYTIISENCVSFTLNHMMLSRCCLWFLQLLYRKYSYKRYSLHLRKAITYTVVDHRCCTTVLCVKNLKI